MTGKVTFVADKKKGDSVTSRDLIVTISGSGSFILEVATGLAEKVPVGTEANCEYNGKNYTGRVVFSTYDKSLNPTSFGLNAGFSGLGVTLDTIPSGITAWETMTVEIIIDKRENALVIPTSAVSTFDDKHYVYIWENGIRTEREVELGIQSVTYYEVISGLSEGEVITY
jgi:macrolide-specific efflux system membrane fusion protein